MWRQKCSSLFPGCCCNRPCACWDCCLQREREGGGVGRQAASQERPSSYASAAPLPADPPLPDWGHSGPDYYSLTFYSGVFDVLNINKNFFCRKSFFPERLQKSERPPAPTSPSQPAEARPPEMLHSRRRSREQTLLLWPSRGRPRHESNGEKCKKRKEKKNQTPPTPLARASVPNALRSAPTPLAPPPPGTSKRVRGILGESILAPRDICSSDPPLGDNRTM